MRIFSFIGSGFLRSVKAWKGILTIWLLSLVLASLAGLPFRAGMKSIIGSSMITELLKDGFSLEAFILPDTGFGTLLLSFFSGFTLVLILGFLMNTFLNGGLFNILRAGNDKPFARQFFTGRGTNFWSFLVINLILSLIIVFTAFLVMGVPSLIVSSSDNSSDATIFRTLRISLIIFIIILPVFILAVDYARAWKAAYQNYGSFGAIGKGFSQTFRYFLSSYPVILIVMAISALLLYLVYYTYSSFVPRSGGGILSLFLILQVLFIIKVFARSWRYGSVTAMLENNTLTPGQEV